MAQIYLTESMFSLKDFYTFLLLVHSVKQILPRKYLITLSSYNTSMNKNQKATNIIEIMRYISHE